VVGVPSPAPLENQATTITLEIDASGVAAFDSTPNQTAPLLLAKNLVPGGIKRLEAVGLFWITFPRIVSQDGVREDGSRSL
jgi:hypothetical protein